MCKKDPTKHLERKVEAVLKKLAMLKEVNKEISLLHKTLNNHYDEAFYAGMSRAHGEAEVLLLIVYGDEGGEGGHN